MENINVGGVEFTPDQIQALKAQAQLLGESTVGDIFDNQGADHTPRIGATSKVTRPQLRTAQGTAIPNQKVTRPSERLARRLGEQHNEELKARAKEKQQLDPTSPEYFKRELDVMRRKLARVEKLLKEKDA